MTNAAIFIDDEGACNADVAKGIVNMRNTAFYDVQNPKSPRFDPAFPKPFYLTPGARRRSYLVKELREYVRSKAAKRDGGNV